MSYPKIECKLCIASGIHCKQLEAARKIYIQDILAMSSQIPIEQCAAFINQVTVGDMSRQIIAGAAFLEEQS